jgi:hypothetical protein
MRRYYQRNAERGREIANASRTRRLEKVRAYDRERGHRVYAQEKERVRNQTYKALLAGKIERQPCEVCGAAKVDAHHDDYRRPLDVRWLCHTHHMELHRVFA